MHPFVVWEPVKTCNVHILNLLIMQLPVTPVKSYPQIPQLRFGIRGSQFLCGKQNWQSYQSACGCSELPDRRIPTSGKVGGLPSSKTATIWTSTAKDSQRQATFATCSRKDYLQTQCHDVQGPQRNCTNEHQLISASPSFSISWTPTCP